MVSPGPQSRRSLESYLPRVQLVAFNQRLRSDLHGEFVLFREHNGMPAYRRAASTTCLRFHPRQTRWVIELEGLSDGDEYSAYAEATGDDCEALHWHVWNEDKERFISNHDLFSTTAPSIVQVVGRQVGKQNDQINGEYELVGAWHNRPAYRKRHALGAGIKYCPVYKRWVIDLEGFGHQNSKICSAWAAASNADHPGDGSLLWHVWESTVGDHVADDRLRVVDAPSQVQVSGRRHAFENSSINGTYDIIGVHEGRPTYISASGHMIRYVAYGPLGRWLIDGGARGTDTCCAFAEANGSCHPGLPELVWHLWDSKRKEHVADGALHSFVAPEAVRLTGRCIEKQNWQINGTFHIQGLFCGRPVYIHRMTGYVIHYSPGQDRWVVGPASNLVSLESLCELAFAQAHGAAHPGNPDLMWSVWEPSRGAHLEDDDIVVDEVRPTVNLTKVDCNAHAAKKRPREKLGQLLAWGKENMGACLKRQKC